MPLLLFLLLVTSCHKKDNKSELNSEIGTPKAPNAQIAIEDSSVVIEISKNPEELIVAAQDSSVVIEISKNPEELIVAAQDSFEVIITAAQDSFEVIITAAQDASDKIIATAQDSSDKIIKQANIEAEIITSRSEIIREFLDQYSLLILSILTLIVIVIFIYTISHLNNKGLEKLDKVFYWRKKIDNNTVVLPEIFISDWNKLSKSIELLTMRVGDVKSKEKDKSLADLVEKLRGALVSFADKINTNSKIGLDEVVKSLEPLKEQVDFQKVSNEELKKGYDYNAKKRFALELIGIKDIIDFSLKSDLGKNNKDMIEISEKIERFFQKIEVYLIKDVYLIRDDNSKTLVDFQGKYHDKIDDDVTNDQSKEGKLSSVKRVGYYFKDLEGNKEIIRKAKVSIYILESEKK